MIRALALIPVGNLYSLRVSPSTFPSGSELTASGARFKGISEASGGNGAQNSSSNYPLVQLLSLANEQTLFLPVDAMTGWSDTSFTSTPVTLMTISSSGFPIGYALVTCLHQRHPQPIAVHSRRNGNGGRNAATQVDAHTEASSDSGAPPIVRSAN